MPKDRHLNLFCSYNQSDEDVLIENNLTRAFIQTLRLLEGENRDNFLKILFARKSEELKKEELKNFDYSNAEFALQNNIDKAISKNARKKYVITITGRALITEDTEQPRPQKTQSDSRPDAWIYDKNSEYCLLIECKLGEGCDEGQIESHIKYWFAGEYEEYQKNKKIIDLAWDDVLWGIDRMKEKVDSKEITLNRQEQIVLDDLFEFMGYYGFFIFKGFDFAHIPEKPDFELVSMTDINIDINIFEGLDFENIPPKPDFELIDIKEVKNGTDNE